jgi:hypothetical protein
MVWNWLKKIFSFQFFGKIVGSAPISTVGYIGYLPEWSRHWSAFASIIFSLVLIYNTAGFDGSHGAMSYYLLLQGIYGFLLANTMVPIFRKAYPFSKNENIVIDSFVAQALFLGLSVPAIVHIAIHVDAITSHLCQVVFICNPFVIKVLFTLLTLLGPYFVLRFFDIMEFWPTNKMFLYAELSINRILAGIIPVLYAVFFIYIFAFLFFDLTLFQVLQFYKAVFHNIYLHFLFVFAVLAKTFTMKNLYLLCKKLGIIHVMDHYGLINMKHYDMKYLG